MENQANPTVGRHGADALTRLLAQYGEMMLLSDLAVEVRSTSNALRLRILRGGDMPPECPPRLRLGRAHRYMTRDVAVWLFGERSEWSTHTAPLPAAKKSQRHRGRPRGSVARRAGQ